MTNHLKNALCYTRTTSKLRAEREFSIENQNDVITAFALANGYNIVDYRNDVRLDLTTDLDWLNEYFGNAHKEVQYLLVFSLDRLGPDLTESIQVAKYLKDRYGVVVMSARQPELNIPNINLDEINRLRLE